MGRALDYKEHLMDLLKDPEEAAAYLNAMLDDDDKEGFLLALRDVAEAQGGLSWLASSTDLRRESLYRTLSRTGNPRLSSLTAVLGAVGLELSVEPIGAVKPKPRKRGAKKKPSAARRRPRC